VTWLKLDDGFPNHPKVAWLPLKARWLLIEAGCWCARYLTDGTIPREIAEGWQGKAMVRAVVTAGLWHQGHGCGTDECVEGDGAGYVVHDFLRYNPSRARVEEERSKKQAAGRAGGRASAQARASAPASPVVQEVPNPVPSRPVPIEPKGSSAGGALDATGIVMNPSGPTVGVARSRPREPIFDTLAAVNGADPRELTTSAARACGVALAEIRKAAPGVTAEEISRRAGNYRTHYPDAALTPSALARRWAESANPAQARGRDPAALIAGGFGA
jgi:hypothetical protein